MNQFKTFLLIIMVIFFTACGGGGSGGSSSDVTVIPDNPQTIAIDKIKAYADNDTQSVPTIEDFNDAGVVGVTVDNIDDVNDVIEGLTPGDVDTKEEIQQIVNDLGINIIPTASAGPDKNIEVNKAVTIIGSGTDSDGTIVSYVWKKDNTEVDSTASFNYIPTFVGTDTLILTVMDDDGATASDSMNVVVVDVLPINQVPTANAGADKNVEVNTAVNIIGSGTDSDGTIVSYVWKKGNTILASTVSFEYTPTAVGTDTLTLIITDDDGASASDSMNVIVEAVPPTNQAPVADAGNDQSVLISETVMLNGSESSDPNSDAISYSWSFTNRPNGSSASLLSTTAMKPTFTADVAGTYVLSLVVNDGTLNSSPDSVTVIATAVPNTALTFENNTPYFISDCYSNDCPGIATSEINVAGAATSIEKVTITLDVTHQNLADLLIRLISPSGTSIILSDPDPEYAFFDWSWNYRDTIFDDHAAISILDAVVDTSSGNITGTYRPEEALDIFIGEDADGTWKLQVEDWVWVHEGTLNSWSITIK